MTTDLKTDVFAKLLNELIEELTVPSTLDKIESLENVQKFLNDLPYINSGGCGISAYSMYLWLRKNNKLPEDFQIVYLFNRYDEETMENNRNFLEGNSDVADSCSHAVIKMDGMHMDSRGLYWVGNYIQLGIDAENIDRFMLNSLNQPKWNRMFNRQQYIPVIEKALGIDLSNVNRVLNY